MGCTSTKFIRYCENPAVGYNVRGIQETLSPDGFVQVQSPPYRHWRGSNKNGHPDKVIITFPMLNSKVSRLVIIFSYFATGVTYTPGREEPRLSLESISPNGQITIQEITLMPVTTQPQVVQLTMEASSIPIIANAQPGDIFRLKVVLPLGKMVFHVSGLNATLFPLVLGVPVARLSFEEFVEIRSGMHTFEIKSYRTWYLRHKLALVGFMNTPPLLHCPQTIEVNMKVDTMKDPRVEAPSNLGSFRYRFELQMVKGSKSFASIPLLSNQSETINLRITDDMTDPKIKRFFQVFRPGYQIQITRNVHHYAGRLRTHLVRVTGFSLKLQSPNNSPFVSLLYHLSKRDALTVLRRENNNGTDEDEAFNYYYDPYDYDNCATSNGGDTGDGGYLFDGDIYGDGGGGDYGGGEEGGDGGGDGFGGKL